jgi:OOP family OmpA-OmpF porin
MAQFKRFFVVTVAAAFLAACAIDASMVKMMQPSGSEFSQSLHKGYVSIGEMEQKKNDWKDGDHFLMKASMAAKGDTPEPDAPESRKIPASFMNPAFYMKQRIDEVLAKGAREKAPFDAAMAQVYFDCWLQEVEENIQPADIKACEEKFEFHMAFVHQFLKPPPKPKAVKAAAPAAPAAPAMAAETVWPFFVVNFDSASAVLTIAAQQKLNEVVAGYRTNKPKEVIVKGHTDKAGDKEANLVLSIERTSAVMNFLLNAGIPNKVFKPESLGESKPVTRVKDGVSHSLDRRVEIELK